MRLELLCVLLLCRGLKGAEGADAAGKGSSKVLSKRESKKSKQQAIDTGVIDAKAKEDKEQNDSFEKYYNKDLDLDEGKSADPASMCVCDPVVRPV